MKLYAFLFAVIIAFCLQVSCSKTGGIPPPPPPDPCSLVIINLNSAITSPSAPGSGDGKITVTPVGGGSYTFSLNGGIFQPTGTFSNLLPGNYTVMARSADGCVATVSFILLDPSTYCTSANIIVSASSTNNVPCETNTASITVMASGGTPPYTYQLDGGIYQTSNIFNNLSSGSHMLVVKDINGCAGSTASTTGNQVAGPMFTQVKSIIQSHCLYCHSATSPSGGISYSTDCNIVANKNRIRARAVDGNPSPMPQTGLIPASERQKIIDWMNAGGTVAN